MSLAAPSPQLTVAMSAMQRVPVLQQNSSSRLSWVDDIRNSRSLSSSQAVCTRSCIRFSSLATRSRVPGRCGTSWLAKAGGEEGADDTQEKVDNNNSATSVASPGESKLSSTAGGAKGFGSPQKASVPDKKKASKSSSGSVRRAPPSKPLIGVSPADQQTQQVETAVVASLAFLFALIFLEGLLLAASGFLPEEWDEFAVNSVYPAFTPSVGVFLAIAAGYGLWKTIGGGTGEGSR